MATSEERAKLRRAGVSTRAQQLFWEGLNLDEVVAGGTPRATVLSGWSWIEVDYITATNQLLTDSLISLPENDFSLL